MHAPPLPPRPAGLSQTRFHPAYLPLPDARSHIRLLVLEPAPTFESPLVGALVHVPLAQQSYFDALSYAWGSLGKTGAISLSGYAYALYESADAALRRLRRASETRAIWIDAMCINQEDSVEKSFQVPLMRQIYQQASQVYVYLGETKDADVLRMTLSSFNQGSSAFTNAAWNSAKFWGKAVVDNFKSKNPLFHKYKILTIHDSYLVDEMRRGEVRELLCRPWWTRTWVLQEAIVAKDVQFMYGPETFGWDLVGSMVSAQSYDMGLGDTYHSTHAPEEAALLGRYEALDELRRAWRGVGDKRIRMLEILYNFRGQGCTDPRDRIYSFLGLAHMTGVFGIETDYQLPTAQVYLRFARVMIEQIGSLDILNCKREWRNVPSEGAQQVYAYHVYDQARYHDINAKVHRSSSKQPKRGWALLPSGWEFVIGGDGAQYYIDHNTGRTQTTSPLEGLPPAQARHPNEYRVCPPGWVREYDNLGRPTISYQPFKSSQLLSEAAATQAALASELSSLPSWVPNWAAPTQHDPSPIPYVSTATGQDLLYRASGDLIAQLSPSPPHILSLSGLHFDTISSISLPFHPPSSTPYFFRRPSDPRAQWESLALSPAVPKDGSLSPSPYSEPRLAFLRLHVGDFIPGEPVPPTDLSDVELWLNPSKFYGGPTIEDLANMSITDMFKTSFNVTAKSSAALHGQYSECAGRIHKFTAHRRLFVTRGGWMGLGSWDVREGDEVVVLRGGKTPFVIRRRYDVEEEKAERYEMIGEAYVQGIMMGEALEMGRGMRVWDIV